MTPYVKVSLKTSKSTSGILSLGLIGAIWVAYSKFVTIDAFRTLATRTALRFRLKHFDPTKNLNPKPLHLARSTITTAASPISILRFI